MKGRKADARDAGLWAGLEVKGRTADARHAGLWAGLRLMGVEGGVSMHGSRLASAYTKLAMSSMSCSSLDVELGRLGRGGKLQGLQLSISGGQDQEGLGKEETKQARTEHTGENTPRVHA